jgi:hypothetical protein
MTLVRRLALKISDAVVRYASPGCKEWAEGLVREVAFIEGEWAALAWAIGSTRVLLDRREARIGSDAGALSKWSIAGGGLDRIFLLMCFLNLLAHFIGIVRAKDWNDRIGWSMVALGWGYWTISFVMDRRRERQAPASHGSLESLRFIRSGMERRLERYRSVRRWFPALATACGCTGLLMAGDPIRSNPIYAGVIILGGATFILLQCLETPANIQKRIGRLDEFIAKRQESR